MKNSDRTFKLSTVVVEALSIVLAVLLALGVDEWREGRSQQRQADSALVNVVKEIKANQVILEKIHENNVETVKTIAEGQGGAEAAGEDEDRSFIPGIQLRETAWESLLSTGTANYVDYDIILELSETYSVQRVYKDTSSQLIRSSMNVAAYAAALGTDTDNAHYESQFADYFEMIIAVETELLEQYQGSISVLDDAGK